MQFNVIIGNPPYNKDVYLDFVTQAYQIALDYVVMITPAKWQAKGGVKNEQFRKNIVPYMSKVVWYPNCSDIFCIGEDSGISYYIIDKDRDKNADVIIENKCKHQELFNTITIRKFDNSYTLNNRVNAIVNKLLSQGIKLGVNLNNRVFNSYKKYTVVCNNKYNIERGVEGQWQAYGMVSYTTGNMSIICRPRIVEDIVPSIDLTNADVAIYTSDNLEECQSIISWINTKFIRFLVSGSIGSMSPVFSNISFRYVPDPGPFNHIFTDEELYKKYNLTPDEINIIESVIKERK